MLSIIIPWQDRGDPDRRRVFAFVRDYYASLGIGEVVIGTYPRDDEPLNRSRLRNAGAAAATGDVLFFIDGDVLVPGEQIQAAAALCHRPGFVLPFNRFVTQTDRQDVEQILDGADWRPFIQPWMTYPRPTKMEWHVAPTYVVSRATFAALGGFDEDYIGWGEEEKDLLFRAAIEVAPLRFTSGGILNLGEYLHDRTDAEPSRDDSFVRNNARLSGKIAMYASGSEPTRAFHAAHRAFFDDDWVTAREQALQFLLLTFDDPRRIDAMLIMAATVWPQYRERWLLRACAEAIADPAPWQALSDHYRESENWVGLAFAASRAT